MTHHTIRPALLSDGSVEIMLIETASGRGNYVVLSNSDAVAVAEKIASLAKAGRKMEKENP